MSRQELTKEQAIAEFNVKKEAYDTLTQEIKDLREDVSLEQRLGLLEKQVEALKALQAFKTGHGL